MVNNRGNHNAYVPRAKPSLLCGNCGKSFGGTRVNQKWCPACRNYVKSGQRAINGIQKFRAIDGEGVGNGRDHKYVLLGVGQEQCEWPNGPENITDIFRFLYRCFRLDSQRIYGGFYLTYDWNMWLR